MHRSASQISVVLICSQLTLIRMSSCVIDTLILICFSCRCNKRTQPTNMRLYSASLLWSVSGWSLADRLHTPLHITLTELIVQYTRNKNLCAKCGLIIGHSLTLSSLHLPLPSSSTTSRELLSQFSSCSG